MPNHRNSVLITLILPAIFIAPLSPNVEAAPPAITGVWSCQTNRPGAIASRPVTFVFHSDGTFAYSSQSTVNGGPLALPFTSRGGGHGEWQKTGTNEYAYRARENMYINGNAGGFFYVDSTLRLDRAADQLCSGKAECFDTQTRIRLTQFTFDPNATITGEIDLIPAESLAETVCNRLSTAFPGL